MSVPSAIHESADQNCEDDASCRASDPLFIAIAQCLQSDSGSCLVVDKNRTVIGRVTLESLRRAIRAGELLAHVTLGQSGALLREPANRDPSTHPLRALPLAVPDLAYPELEALLDAFLSTWISGRGPHVDAFERTYADFTWTSHAVAVSSGTAALHLALLALGIGNGDEVIVPDLTFAATINAVIHAGATPVIADIDPESFGLCPSALERAVTPRTKAVVPVHLYGRPVLSETIAVARSLDLAIVEDCAEAQGARLQGAPVGSHGDVGCFSLFANKLITTGEGGMCVTSNAEHAKRMAELRDHGVSCAQPFWHTQVGYNYRLTNLQAAIGFSQLRRFDEILAKRTRIDALYREQLKTIPAVRFPESPKNGTSVTWLSVACVPPEKRDVLIAAARAEAIELRAFFHPLSVMPIYRAYVRNPCADSHVLSAAGICLPSGSEHVDDIARVARVFHRVLG